MRSVALPEGTRLLHIGPFKTGTTTVQAAFHQNRDRLRAQGVHYAGKNAQPMTAAIVATGGHLPTDASTGLDRWTALLDEIHTAGAPRTVLSSEFFCGADTEHIRSILDDLGRERTHVVITLRPLVKILASQWQQFIQNRVAVPYPVWLDAMLNHGEETSITPTFWLRHRHDRLVRRWADVVGRENLTVVVVDENDKGMLMRSFEQMLSLEPGTLVPRDVSANRSLTYAEAEMMRAFNEQYVERGWSTADYTKLVRFGAARYLQERRPGPDEARVLTPPWAVERAVGIAADMVRDIASSGVRIVGDLDSLTLPLADSAVGDNPEHVCVSVEVASRFSVGLLECAAAVPGKPASSSRAAGPLEQSLRVRHELRRVRAELRRVSSELERARSLGKQTGRPVDLTRREALTVLAHRVPRRLRSWARRP